MEARIARETNLPPMLAQYVQYKERYPDCLIFCQVGDFYELFFDDAVTVSQVLNLTLTSRDKNNPDPIPMCGVPIAVVDAYVERLIDRNYSVAIVSQVGTAGATKGGVERKLERIITPGVRILSAQGAKNSTSVVAAIALQGEHEIAVAFSEVETGLLSVREVAGLSRLKYELLKIGPSELILPRQLQGKTLDKRSPWVRDLAASGLGGALKFRVERAPSAQGARQYVALPGYSNLGVAAQKAVRLLLDHIDETTVEAVIPIREIVQAQVDTTLVIDATTRANLELVANQKDGGEEGSLLAFLNQTLSVGGKKMLRQWILNPLRDVSAIVARQESVKVLRAAVALREELRVRLRGLNDIERIAARTELLIVSPRELGALRDCFEVLPTLKALIAELQTSVLLEGLGRLHAVTENLAAPKALQELLSQALLDSPAATLSEGKIIREGFSAELDAVRAIRQTGEAWLEEFEQRERARTGISSLKVKFNNVFGFFIEITKANVAKAPDDYVRKQTTVNGERYTTPELKEREREVLGAEDKQIALERKLFDELRLKVKEYTHHVRILAQALSELDVLQSLAEVADKESLVCPHIDQGRNLIIQDGKHPVLHKLLGPNFVANSLELGPELENDRKALCAIITGPNMGGKSTYLRQAALLVILAQLGSFLPVAEARIGLVDKIFARIGATDNLREGESTFMVEMREAALIINTASDRSLVLIDEIGRGTATLDGLSLARAILEWILVKIQARTLFATHFHELTGLVEQYESLVNLSVGSVERGEEILFTHQICDGAASKSYGLEVAKLAGLPKQLLNRARQVLAEMEEKRENGAERAQLSLFQPAQAEISVAAEPDPRIAKLVHDLKAVEVNSLTPVQALNELHRLREAAADLDL